MKGGGEKGGFLLLIKKGGRGDGERHLVREVKTSDSINAAHMEGEGDSFATPPPPRIRMTKKKKKKKSSGSRGLQVMNEKKGTSKAPDSVLGRENKAQKKVIAGITQGKERSPRWGKRPRRINKTKGASSRFLKEKGAVIVATPGNGAWGGKKKGGDGIDKGLLRQKKEGLQKKASPAEKTDAIF